MLVGQVEVAIDDFMQSLIGECALVDVSFAHLPLELGAREVDAVEFGEPIRVFHVE